MQRPTTLLIRDHLEWLIESATEQTRGDISKAAKLLGVDRGTLSHWVNHGLTKKYYRSGDNDAARSAAVPHAREVPEGNVGAGA